LSDELYKKRKASGEEAFLKNQAVFYEDFTKGKVFTTNNI